MRGKTVGFFPEIIARKSGTPRSGEPVRGVRRAGALASRRKRGA